MALRATGTGRATVPPVRVPLLEEKPTIHLAVFGASGPTGLLVVRQALSAGHSVVAVTRRPEAFPLDAPGLQVVGADVVDAEAVERALPGVQAVISTYGVPYGKQDITVYSRGIATIAGAMQAHGIERLVCVTSATVASGHPPGESLFWGRVVHPLLRHRLGRTLYDDMERMEDIVRASNLDWTIVRPGGLFDATEPTPDYQVGTGRLAGQTTSRADVAAVLVGEATDPQHPRSTIEVMTRLAKPSPLNFVREAFGGR